MDCTIYESHPCEKGEYFEGTDSGLLKNLIFFRRGDGSRFNCGEPFINGRYCLIVNHGGEGVISLDFYDIPFEVGRALLIFPHQLQIIQEVSRERLSWTYMVFDLEGEGIFESLRYRPFLFEEKRALLYGESLQNWLKAGRGVIYSQLAGTYAYTMLCEAVLQYGSPAVQIKDLPYRTGGEVELHGTSGLMTGEALILKRQIQTALWRRNFDADLESLASDLKLSVSGLTRKCLRLLGLTPGNLIREFRLENGSKLLKESCLTIGQISLACGYTGAGSFIRSFRDKTGFTPRSYREKWRRECFAAVRVLKEEPIRSDSDRSSERGSERW